MYSFIAHAWLGGWEGCVGTRGRTIQQAGKGKGPGCQGFRRVGCCFWDHSDWAGARERIQGGKLGEPNQGRGSQDKEPGIHRVWRGHERQQWSWTRGFQKCSQNCTGRYPPTVLISGGGIMIQDHHFYSIFNKSLVKMYHFFCLILGVIT